MKYVVFKQKNLFLPVLIPDCAVHAYAQMLDATPDSAGFFHVSYIDEKNIEVVIEPEGSESLNLMPSPVRDANLIKALLENHGMYSFINFNNNF